jgi:hypothetical protein
MPPKRKFGDTTMFSGGSSSSDDLSSNSSIKNSDNDEDRDIYYESMMLNPHGPANYKASIMTLVAPASPTKPTAAKPKLPAGSSVGDTWIYDFMDNDWTFPVGQENLAAEDSEEQPPDTSSSGSETEVPLKREPVSAVIAICVPLSNLQAVQAGQKMEGAVSLQLAQRSSAG